MPTVKLSPLGGAAAQFFTNNGVILSGGKLYTYEAGTTNPQTSYTDSTGNTAHQNPIILDSAGRVPSGGEIWLDTALVYKFVLTTSTDVEIGAWDNIEGIKSSVGDLFVDGYLDVTGDIIGHDDLVILDHDNVTVFSIDSISRSGYLDGAFTCEGIHSTDTVTIDEDLNVAEDVNITGVLTAVASAKAWGYVLADGTNQRTARCSVARTATGAYTITFESALSLNRCVIVSVDGEKFVYKGLIGSTTTEEKILIVDTTSSSSDTPFSFVVFD